VTNVGEAVSAAVGSFTLYLVLSVVAFALSFYGPASAVFSIIQILWVLLDVEVAETKPSVPSFVSALVTTTMGWLFQDQLAYGFGIVVILLILLKGIGVLERLLDRL
jgi:hypothetical protein